MDLLKQAGPLLSKKNSGQSCPLSLNVGVRLPREMVHRQGMGFCSAESALCPPVLFSTLQVQISLHATIVAGYHSTCEIHICITMIFIFRMSLGMKCESVEIKDCSVRDRGDAGPRLLNEGVDNELQRIISVKEENQRLDLSNKLVCVRLVTGKNNKIPALFY